MEQLLGAEHSLARLARSVLASGGSAVENECRVERRFDTPLTVDVAASPLFDDDRPDGTGRCSSCGTAPSSATSSGS